MATYTQLMALVGGRRLAADPRRGRGADRRRAGAQPRHDRRQRLLERPDEPPAAAARRARRVVRDPRCGRRAHGRRGGVLPRRLHDRGRRGRAAGLGLGPGRGEGGRRLRLDHDRPRRHVHRERGRQRSTDGATRIALGCVDAVPVAAAAGRRRRGERPRRRWPAPASTRPPTSTPRPTTGATSPGVCAVRAVAQAAGEGRVSMQEPVTSRAISVEVNGEALRARRRRAAAARPLHPRRPRADRHAHRLRHGQLRRLHDPARRPGGEELHAARRPGGRGVDRDGRGAGRRRRRADTAPAVVLRRTTRSSAATARPGC